MCRLNDIGTRLGQLESVTAMTDVTGFGLLGHLLEVCQGSGVAAQLDFERIPLLDPSVEDYRRAGCVPGGGERNHASYGHLLGPLSERQRQILCDPQTSGGLLVAVRQDAVAEFRAVAPGACEIGKTLPRQSGDWITLARDAGV
jgi:selenide,water dikinase